jgi:hypothetical protein
MSVSVTKLKKKYPHPACASRAAYDDYCVGGALCHEVGMSYDFPNEQQLRDAILKANPKIDWYAISDSDSEHIRTLVSGVIEANDVGNFKLSWQLLGKLLHMAPKVRM